MEDRPEFRRQTDDEVLRLASAGDPEAFVAFCNQAIPTLYRYVRRQCRHLHVPVDLAEDFCHEAVVRALRHIGDCRVGGHRPLPVVSQAWLFQIAINILRDWKRRNQRFTECDDLEYIESPVEASAEEIEEYEEILKFMKWLGDDEREILELVFLNGMSVTQAGADIGLRESNANKKFHKALDTLKDFMAMYSERSEESTYL